MMHLLQDKKGKLTFLKVRIMCPLVLLVKLGSKPNAYLMTKINEDCIKIDFVTSRNQNLNR